MMNKKNILLIIALLIIIASYTINIRQKEETKNEKDIKTTKKSQNNKKVEMTKYLDISKINDFFDCYNSPIAEEDFTEKMKEKLSEIEKHFNSNKAKVSFSYEDLQTGMHIGYNETQEYFSASVIKSPIVLYLYVMNQNGEIDFNETITYTPGYYWTGTGSIQYDPFYTKYSIKELIYKAIVESDNIAYLMLCSKINKNNIKNFYQEKGATTFWKQSYTIWGDINSKDGALYMKELYKFIEEYPEYEQDILDKYSISINQLIVLDDENIIIAHKSGWTDSAIHDMAIVYDDHPYVLSINTLLRYNNYKSFFKEATNLIDEFHEIYWNQKIKYCQNKIFE